MHPAVQLPSFLLQLLTVALTTDIVDFCRSLLKPGEWFFEGHRKAASPYRPSR